MKIDYIFLKSLEEFNIAVSIHKSIILSVRKLERDIEFVWKSPTAVTKTFFSLL